MNVRNHDAESLEESSLQSSFLAYSHRPFPLCLLSYQSLYLLSDPNAIISWYSTFNFLRGYIMTR
ncbi:hypothetical protein C8J56DRAFT_1164595 [Mycena floridula]|nr:hypothetical protein C8J56DRAFT_1164595 [Mycena floridula]